jgi:hypothetical protein
MWKAAVMALFEVMLFQHLPHGTEENRLNQDNWSLDQDSNVRPSEYKAGFLSTQL